MIANHILYGGDYNPDQWLDYPQVLKEDLRLMRLAGINTVSVGIFAWTALEPEEGQYNFEWLDGVIEGLSRAGVSFLLATPSGARPAWMAKKYPEILRVGADRRRNLFGQRQNHCYTSLLYREKVWEINTRLAQRYGRHPNLLVWHLSNEYGGECHCDLCQDAFRQWLRNRYNEDLKALNHAWWAPFWSHTYTDWEEIESPAPHGEQFVHGHNLDWKRFVTHQTRDFMRNEIAALRSVVPEARVTTNLMGMYPGLDYFKIAEPLDIVSWDSYPCWHGIGTLPNPRGEWNAEGDDVRLASDAAFAHDLTRSLGGGKPWLLMESTPSTTNWQSVSKLKRPGFNAVASMQAVAHGSDAVLYFQWRKGRGGCEKFHGAVVDHVGHENTRVFQEVAALGSQLSRISPVVGSIVKPVAAVLYDWENRWALVDAQGPRNDGRMAYVETVRSHYFQLWRRGIPTDVIDEEQDFSPYRLLLAPLLYLVKPGIAERIEAFVKAGGTFVATYWSGIVNETDLCFLGGFPGPLRPILGVWSEEIDSLYPEERRRFEFVSGNPLGLSGSWEAKELCDLVHLEGAQALAVYSEDFYAGRPALTLNSLGSGEAYYISSRTDEDFLNIFYESLFRRIETRTKVPLSILQEVPYGISVTRRIQPTDPPREFLFVMNLTAESKKIQLTDGWEYSTDLLTDNTSSSYLRVAPYGFAILTKGSCM